MYKNWTLNFNYLQGIRYFFVAGDKPASCLRQPVLWERDIAAGNTLTNLARDLANVVLRTDAKKEYIIIDHSETQ